VTKLQRLTSPHICLDNWRWLVLAFWLCFIHEVYPQEKSADGSYIQQTADLNEDQTNGLEYYDEDDTQTESESNNYQGNFTLEDGEKLPRSNQSKSYHSQIKKILDNDDFSRKESVKRWRFKQDKDERNELYPEWLIEFVEWLEGLIYQVIYLDWT